MTRLCAIAALAASILTSISAFAKCAPNSDPGPFMTTCPCTNQRVETTSCQASETGDACETVFQGDYCGSSGHVSCYVGYAEDDDCFDAKREATSALLLDPTERSWESPKVAMASCDGGSRSLADWLRNTPRFSDRQTKSD